ncbi:MAG: T9SS type A sorting domain-containing protein [Bacteroidales bacterium]|nr:T9SS type A sorting domain-containing protein [Bacteroidales bacterium]
MKKYTLIILTLLTTINVFTQTPGSLDLSFGDAGIVITDLSNYSDFVYSMAIQTDGKIVVTGESYNGENTDFSLVRYNTDGTLDNTFGTDGIVTTDINNLNDETRAIAIQTDGKIVVTGISSNGTDYDIAVIRYNSDGTLDNTFGTNGIVITPVGEYYDWPYAVAIQTDGKIVVTGNIYITYYNSDIIVIRYNTDGTLDNSFGAEGKVITAVSSTDDNASAVAVQTDGKIVTAGSSGTDFAVLRYNTNGTLDNTFGTNGIIITDNGFARAIILQTDGKIVTAGGSDADFAVVRYNTDGTLDNTFGTNGIVRTDINDKSNYAWAVAIQTNGKIVTAGYSYNDDMNTDFALVRYNINGTLDNTFGTDGIVTTDIENYSNQVRAVAIQNDGKIVVAGTLFYEPSDFALARYAGDPVGINEHIIDKKISVYPNPTTGIIKIKTKNLPAGQAGIQTIEVTDITGKIISILKDKTEIDLSKEPKGIYFVKVITNNGIAVEKIVLE